MRQPVGVPPAPAAAPGTPAPGPSGPPLLPAWLPHQHAWWARMWRTSTDFAPGGRVHCDVFRVRCEPLAGFSPHAFACESSRPPAESVSAYFQSIFCVFFTNFLRFSRIFKVFFCPVPHRRGGGGVSSRRAGPYLCAYLRRGAHAARADSHRVGILGGT